jgi:hypothetical protein
VSILPPTGMYTFFAFTITGSVTSACEGTTELFTNELKRIKTDSRGMEMNLIFIISNFRGKKYFTTLV